ncbi:triose-phosphate isomerase [Arthrobacter sp. KBS0703]|uniref:triose-phosphate isomerase n=1 Tax=Bacteria TaxID=2 RepID=UPI000990149F|nr:triose-phosphate isomerase [Arthrobacter sp. KBS0703]TSE17719.1 triose-phosphate isomerase [Arthrobacter sp. KBS0703]
MKAALTAPFFEIGPKNFLRRAELEALAHAAGRAGSEFDVAVVLTVPIALVAPIADLRTGVLVFAQGMDADLPGDSVGRVTAESLVDAGAAGVMLNHDSNPLDNDSLARTVHRAQAVDLQTVVCAGTEADAFRYTTLGPTAVLFEPPELIGTAGNAVRAWIPGTTAVMREAHPDVLVMHAGGVASPSIARAIMAAGADGTGSTSGVLTADNPCAAARSFIAAARAGWDDAQTDAPAPTNHQHQ